MKMTGAKYMADTIKGIGCSHVFLMETACWSTMQELELNGVKRIICHTEKTAAYMADAYARIAKKPGFVFCQSVGAANMAAGLQEPYLSNSPVVALTGKKNQILQHRNSYQELNHIPLYEPVTKYNVSIEIIEQLPFYFRQAIREAVSGNPGPAHLDMINVLGFLDRAEGNFLPIDGTDEFKVPSHRIPPDQASIEKVAELLKESERPVIIAGGGVILSGAGAAVTAMAERLNIPVATSVNGKGSINEDHRLSIGCVGNYSRDTANIVVSGADLVIYIGSHTNDQVTLDWRIPKPDVSIVQIDINPSELGKNYQIKAGVLGDALLSVKALSECAEPHESREWMNYVRRVISEWKAEHEAESVSNDSPIRPERLCRELERVMPDDAVLVSDTGQSAIWTCSRIELKGNQTYIRPGGGSLGWGFPASIGAKCAAGDRPVFCFTGDGGLWYHLTAMETQIRYGIKTITVVNNNYGYGQGSRFRRELFKSQQFEHSNYEFGKESSFADIARAMGAFAVKVDKPEKLSGALVKALESDRPALVEVISDIMVEAPDPWKPER